MFADIQRKVLCSQVLRNPTLKRPQMMAVNEILFIREEKNIFFLLE